MPERSANPRVASSGDGAPRRAALTGERDRLVELLWRATRAMTTALEEALRTHDELALLVRTRQERTLTHEERERYAVLSRSDRAAMKRYLAARHWRDAVAGRMGELRFRLRDGPATAGG